MVTQNTKGYLKDDFDVKADMDPEERKKKMKIVSSIPEVLSCAGLLHDLGNPPFGHFGKSLYETGLSTNAGRTALNIRKENTGFPVRKMP